MSSDRAIKLQWSHSQRGWGERSDFSNAKSQTNNQGGSSSGNTGDVTTGQGHSTTGQMDVQWNSSNNQAGQNKARCWGSGHRQGAPSKADRKVTFLIYCQSQARLKPKRCLDGFIFTL